MKFMEEGSIKFMGFEILMAVSIKIMVFWDVTPCSLIDTYQDLEDPAASIFRIEIIPQS
jgi:hypothetical protein